MDNPRYPPHRRGYGVLEAPKTELGGDVHYTNLEVGTGLQCPELSQAEEANGTAILVFESKNPRSYQDMITHRQSIGSYCRSAGMEVNRCRLRTEDRYFEIQIRDPEIRYARFRCWNED